MIFTCAVSLVGAIVACFVTVPPLSKKKLTKIKVEKAVTGLESEV